MRGNLCCVVRCREEVPVRCLCVGVSLEAALEPEMVFPDSFNEMSGGQTLSSTAFLAASLLSSNSLPMKQIMVLIRARWVFASAMPEFHTSIPRLS